MLGYVNRNLKHIWFKHVADTFLSHLYFVEKIPSFIIVLLDCIKIFFLILKSFKNKSSILWKTALKLSFVA